MTGLSPKTEHHLSRGRELRHGLITTPDVFSSIIFGSALLCATQSSACPSSRRQVGCSCFRGTYPHTTEDVRAACPVLPAIFPRPTPTGSDKVTHLIDGLRGG